MEPTTAEPIFYENMVTKEVEAKAAAAAVVPTASALTGTRRLLYPDMLCPESSLSSLRPLSHLRHNPLYLNAAIHGSIIPSYSLIDPLTTRCDPLLLQRYYNNATAQSHQHFHSPLTASTADRMVLSNDGCALGLLSRAENDDYLKILMQASMEKSSILPTMPSSPALVSTGDSSCVPFSPESNLSLASPAVASKKETKRGRSEQQQSTHTKDSKEGTEAYFEEFLQRRHDSARKAEVIIKALKEEGQASPATSLSFRQNENAGCSNVEGYTVDCPNDTKKRSKKRNSDGKISKKVISAKKTTMKARIKSSANDSMPGQRTYVERIRDLDILCGRGGLANHHVGNYKFRKVIRDMKSMYNTLEKKTKTDLSRAIVNHVLSYGGRFIKKVSALDDSKELPFSKADILTEPATSQSKNTDFSQSDVAYVSASSFDNEESHKNKRKNSRYYILSHEEARKKTSQALRERIQRMEVMEAD